MGMRQFYRPVRADHADRLGDVALLRAYTQPYLYPPGHLDRLAHMGMPASLLAEIREAQRVAHTLPPAVGIDKAWDGLRTLFAGTPLEGAVMGLDPLPGLDRDYGPPRWVPPDRVRAFAQAFRDADGLDDGAAARLAEAGAYPGVWLDEHAGDWLRSARDCMAELYAATAEAGQGIITWTS